MGGWSQSRRPSSRKAKERWKEAMRATRWEFRQRTWLFFGIFCVGLACYRWGPRSSGDVLAGWIRSNVAFFRADPQHSIVRCIFLIGAFVVGIGAMIRAWGGAYLRAEVFQDSKVRTERLVADGPFRHTRNPLYLGILIGMFGAGVMCNRLGWAAQVGAYRCLPLSVDLARGKRAAKNAGRKVSRLLQGGTKATACDHATRPAFQRSPALARGLSRAVALVGDCGGKFDMGGYAAALLGGCGSRNRLRPFSRPEVCAEDIFPAG